MTADDALPDTDPFEAAVEREARYEQAIRSGRSLADVLTLAVALVIHVAIVRDDTALVRTHALITVVWAAMALFAWFHDEKLGRRPVVTRWRNVVVVRRPGPKL